MRRVAGSILMGLFAVEAAALLVLVSMSGLMADALGILALVGIGAAQGLTLWAYFRIARRVMHPEHVPAVVHPRPDRRPPVPAPAPEDLEGVPEPTTACPDCGYLGVRMPELRDGLWPGGGELGGRIVCGRCGYQGVPVSFERREEYAAFLREMGTARDADAAPSP